MLSSWRLFFLPGRFFFRTNFFITKSGHPCPLYKDSEKLCSKFSPKTKIKGDYLRSGNRSIHWAVTVIRYLNCIPRARSFGLYTMQKVAIGKLACRKRITIRQRGARPQARSAFDFLGPAIPPQCSEGRWPVIAINKIIKSKTWGNPDGRRPVAQEMKIKRLCFVDLIYQNRRMQLSLLCKTMSFYSYGTNGYSIWT